VSISSSSASVGSARLVDNPSRDFEKLAIIKRGFPVPERWQSIQFKNEGRSK
jgi:hypothetical protein